MAAYAVTVKVLICDFVPGVDSIAGSSAKALGDYIETLDAAKTIRSITSVMPSNSTIVYTIVSDT